MSENKDRNNLIKRIEELNGLLVKLLDKYCYLCLLVVFAVFLFSRLFHLGVTPAGIHYDEAGMAFDAKTLAMYGKDRHNNSFPFYLPAYGGGQSALYAYSLALLLKFVPFSMFVMRLPAVIWGCVAFVSSFFLVKDMNNDKKWALMGPILVTIIPYFMTSERWGLDCNLFLSLAILSFWLFYRAHLRDRYRDYVVAGFALGITLYSYVLSYIVLPIFIFFVVLYILAIKRDNFREFPLLKYIVMAIPMGIMALPLLIMQLINMGKTAPFSVGIFDFPRLGFYRGGEMKLSAIFKNIDRLWMMFFRGEQFSFTVVPHFNPIYLIMIPFIVGGFIICVVNSVKAVRDKKLSYEPFVLAFTIAGYLMVMMITDVLNIYTGNELYFMYALYVIVCLKWLVDFTYQKINSVSWVILPVILCAFAICFLTFSNYYFRHYNEECGVQFMFVSTEYGDVVKFTNDNYNPEHKKIYYVRSPLHQSYGEVIVGMALTADPATWESNFDNNNMIDNVYLGLPEEEIDLNDGSVIYILSRENCGHMVPYFIDAGWNVDDSWESYSVVWK